MGTTNSMASLQVGQDFRIVQATWNWGLLAASMSVSLLGSFTSSQLMCQARVSRAFFAIVVWILLASLVFGFCGIWSLHFVALLAYTPDIFINLSASMTTLSALTAVTFTFLALSTDAIYEKHLKGQYSEVRNRRKTSFRDEAGSVPWDARERASTELSIADDVPSSGSSIKSGKSKRPATLMRATCFRPPEFSRVPIRPYSDDPQVQSDLGQDALPPSSNVQHQSAERCRMTSMDSSRSMLDDMSEDTDSRRNSSVVSGSDTASRIERIVSIYGQQSFEDASDNAFKVIALALWRGLTPRTLAKSFVWACSVTSMHVIGTNGMEFDGHYEVVPAIAGIAHLLSWTACTIACILMARMETNLPQQVLFSVLTTTLLAAMHFTGMAATSFYTHSGPTEIHGYPPSMPTAVALIAIVTCLASNGLLAQAATTARDKLAEIVRTRRKLWAAIAQKENAEAAALARSEFIASASHEIRTPLHQLQGYSDLMARCPLPDDTRLLLFAIQDATKTLSLITNNVLDWSRLEKGEAVSKPVSVDVRAVCDSVITLLPRRDDDFDVELIVLFAPTVPKYLYFDETYLQRITINLVSNALKFTTAGYVYLLLDLVDSTLMISVQDTGVGIPRSFMPQLFEPFKQAETLGAERGTGLGLSIVQQLVHNLSGNIQVESSHRDAFGVGSANCGSTFTVTIPVTLADAVEQESDSLIRPEHITRLAYFDNSQSRLLEALVKVWGKLNVDVVTVNDVDDLTEEYRYVWVDVNLLKTDTTLRDKLAQRKAIKVLISYDTENTLYGILGLFSPPHFIPIKRPFVFHHIMKAIANAGQTPTRSDLAARTVRFASQNSILSNTGSICDPELAACLPPTPLSLPSSPLPLSTTTTPSPSCLSKSTTKNSNSKPIKILLVEDNKINQKLGAKMLKTLGYDVVTASDGQEAVDLLIQSVHDTSIDAILMDQNMPRKDGLTATKEIREMERNKTLVGAKRWKGCKHRRRCRPIIAVTAVVGPVHEAMCKDVGTSAFLAKPLSLGRLKAVLDDFTGEEFRGDKVDDGAGGGVVAAKPEEGHGEDQAVTSDKIHGEAILHERDLSSSPALASLTKTASATITTTTKTTVTYSMEVAA